VEGQSLSGKWSQSFGGKLCLGKAGGQARKAGGQTAGGGRLEGQARILRSGPPDLVCLAGRPARSGLSGPPDLVCLAGRPARSGLSGRLGLGVTIRNGLPGRLSGPPDLVCLAGRPGRSGLSGRLGLGVTIRKALPGRPARQIWSVRPTRSGLFGWPARQIPGPVIRRPRGDIAKWTAYFGLGAFIRPSLVFMPVIDGSHGR
jgi:hypothetical protein